MYQNLTWYRTLDLVYALVKQEKSMVLSVWR